MNVRDAIRQAKKELEQIDVELTEARARVDVLAEAKRELREQVDDLQGYLDWKAAQP